MIKIYKNLLEFETLNWDIWGSGYAIVLFDAIEYRQEIYFNSSLKEEKTGRTIK